MLVEEQDSQPDGQEGHACTGQVIQGFSTTAQLATLVGIIPEQKRTKSNYC